MWQGVSGTKACAYCGKTFTPTGRNQKFCSVECRVALAEKDAGEKLVDTEEKLVVRKCENCDKVFVPKNNPQRFCSTECRRAFHQKAHVAMSKSGKASPIAENERFCQNCKKVFTKKTPSDRFCSAECADEYKRTHSDRAVEKICVTCGRIFVGTERIRNCSPTCQRIYEVFKHRTRIWERMRQRLHEVQREGKWIKFSDAEILADDLVLGTNHFSARHHSNLDKTIAEAKAAGMSYGKYVAWKRYGIRCM